MLFWKFRIINFEKYKEWQKKVVAKPKYGEKVNYKKTHKGTSIGKKPITSTMNKNKRKGRSKKQIRQSRRRSK